MRRCAGPRRQLHRSGQRDDDSLPTTVSPSACRSRNTPRPWIVGEISLETVRTGTTSASAPRVASMSGRVRLSRTAILTKHVTSRTSTRWRRRRAASRRVRKDAVTKEYNTQGVTILAAAASPNRTGSSCRAAESGSTRTPLSSERCCSRRSSCAARRAVRLLRRRSSSGARRAHPQ